MDITKIHHSLRAEMAVAKIKELYENNEYVYHTKICKEFNIKIISVISLLKKEHFFNELKMQNKRIAYEKNVLYRHKIRDSENEKEVEDPIILREIRKKAKVVVKLE